MFQTGLEEPSVSLGIVSLVTFSLMSSGFGGSKSNRYPTCPPLQANVFLLCFVPGQDPPYPGTSSPCEGVAFYPSKAAILMGDGEGWGLGGFLAFSPATSCFCLVSKGQLLSLLSSRWLLFDLREGLGLGKLLCPFVMD